MTNVPRTLGYTLAFLLVVAAITGAALSAFYSPSTTDAWASVAYIQDRATWGWLVRGIHTFAAYGAVILGGVHLFHSVVTGAYRKPRHVNWWIGIALLGLIVGMALTGFVLRWDQAGYWANKVEVGIAGGTPIIGAKIQSLAFGGNDSGNLTLTRFHMLHVIALPAIAAILSVLHVRRGRRDAAPREASDMLRDAIAMAIAMAAVIAISVAQHGIDLGPPADPASAYDARPLWFVRWLFELRHLAGSWEKLAALVAPGIVAGALVTLPMVDRTTDGTLKKRLPFIGGVAGMFAVITALTVMSFARDANDPKRDEAMAKVEARADLARTLAQKYGVPATGANDVFATPPMYRARVLYKQLCSDCHDAASAKRVGPIIGPGHGDRAWMHDFLVDPSGPRFWGKSKLGAGEAAMPKMGDLQPADLDAVVEAMIAESGAPVDAAKRDLGLGVFEKSCTDCHSRAEDTAGGSGPGLGGLGSRAFYVDFIGNPKSPIHMGPDAEMPRFDKELSIVDRDLIAAYLVWLRTAKQADLDALEE